PPGRSRSSLHTRRTGSFESRKSVSRSTSTERVLLIHHLRCAGAVQWQERSTEGESARLTSARPDYRFGFPKLNGCWPAGIVVSVNVYWVMVCEEDLVAATSPF